MTQLMEDVWVSHDLDQYWSHPLNEGWMAYFNRWASTIRSGGGGPFWLQFTVCGFVSSQKNGFALV